MPGMAILFQPGTSPESGAQVFQGQWICGAHHGPSLLRSKATTGWRPGWNPGCLVMKPRGAINNQQYPLAGGCKQVDVLWELKLTQQLEDAVKACDPCPSLTDGITGRNYYVAHFKVNKGLQQCQSLFRWPFRLYFPYVYMIQSCMYIFVFDHIDRCI